MSVMHGRVFEKVGVPGMPTAGFAEPGAVAKAMVRDIACSADLSRVYGTTAEQAKFLAGSVLPLCFAAPLTAGNLCIEMLRSLRRRSCSGPAGGEAARARARNRMPPRRALGLGGAPRSPPCAQLRRNWLGDE